VTNTKELTLNDVVHTDDYTIGCLTIPSSNGDTRVMWDTRDEASVAEVRRVFDEMVKANHMLAEKVTEAAGHQGEQIRDFDPEAEVIVVHRPLAGG
jgi:hypothetical protein